MSFDAELKLMQAIERVREIHQECTIKNCNDCHTCDKPFPCETIQALDGETS